MCFMRNEAECRFKNTRNGKVIQTNDESCNDDNSKSKTSRWSTLAGHHYTYRTALYVICEVMKDDRYYFGLRNFFGVSNAFCLFGKSRGKRACSLPSIDHNRRRIWFRNAVICCIGEAGWFSRLATAQSRLPSRFPGPETAVMSSTMWFGTVTTNPRRLSEIGPMSRWRIGHVLGPVGIWVAAKVRL
jgi:hypothetical protein